MEEGWVLMRLILELIGVLFSLQGVLLGCPEGSHDGFS